MKYFKVWNQYKAENWSGKDCATIKQLEAAEILTATSYSTLVKETSLKDVLNAASMECDVELLSAFSHEEEEE